MEHQANRLCAGQMRILNVTPIARIIYTTTTALLNTGSNKKMEALLHRVLDELREVREEIKLIKGNKTIGKYKIYYLNYLMFIYIC